MKAVKLSLAAALVASSAMALEIKDVKVEGEAKVWYQTKGNSDASQSLFGKAGATGQATASVGITGSLAEKVGFGAKGVVLDTLGLESNTVSNVAAGGSANLKNQSWLSEAYFTYKAGNTVAKVGRQSLDTPLAFSEDWNVVSNTFEALAVINSDIPNTTLVGAHVSRGNGIALNSGTSTNGYTITADGAFDTYVTNGARAVGAINTSISGVTAQAWYYDVINTAKAYWLQADAKLPMGITAGAQYASVDVDIKGTNLDATNAYAVKVGGDVSGVNVYAAYSSVGDSNGLPVANTATNFKKTKLYTASIFSDGTVAAQPDVKAYKVGASTKVGDFTLAASYASYDVGKNGGVGAAYGANSDIRNANYQANPTEIDVSVSTKVADVKVTAHYINQAEFKVSSAGVTQDQQAVRVIASIGF